MSIAASLRDFQLPAKPSGSTCNLKPGQRVQHTFQANGLPLDDAWCEFFKAVPPGRSPSTTNEQET